MRTRERVVEWERLRQGRNETSFSHHFQSDETKVHVYDVEVKRNKFYSLSTHEYCSTSVSKKQNKKTQARNEFPFKLPYPKRSRYHIFWLLIYTIFKPNSQTDYGRFLLFI